MLRLCVSVFGGFEARVRGRETSVVLQFPTRKAEALVAYLALRGNGRHRRGYLCELLWGDVPDAQARHSLRQTLTDIRTVLQPHVRDLLVTSEDTVAFVPGRVWVDALAFERLLRSHTRRPIATACRLYKGDFLEGINTREGAFESWANVERLAYKQRAIEAYERWMYSLSAAGETGDALQAALRLVAMDPLSEPVHRALMTLYVQRGRLAAALRQYEICADILARELGIAPEAETTQLLRRIQATRAEAAAHAPRERPARDAGSADRSSTPAVERRLPGDRRGKARLKRKPRNGKP